MHTRRAGPSSSLTTGACRADSARRARYFQDYIWLCRDDTFLQMQTGSRPDG
ncbi:hypothetical protein BCV70DRAFT_202363 [Testicularia cyperi]|uniref:Uncharacterized protein n=1 Tax=Testicularia cyperi TaxID=1882483 RepID=A0A317XJ64_9BASI|nr:hypothetical protein BCV70DRAFT_202363 [Testicularia cyperi]